jgi:hypothetical protein
MSLHQNIVKKIKLGFTYVGDAKLISDGKTWKMYYDDNIEVNKNKNNRVYVIISNDEVKKIGSSSSRYGIKDTLRHYENPGNNGSIRSKGVHDKILNELKQNKKVKFYCKYNESKIEKVNGIYSNEEQEVCSNIINMEKLCLKDYYKIYNNYPEWNMKERNLNWKV